MGNTATNVSVGKPATSGAIYRAPLNSTLPTSPDDSLAAAYKCLGYVSADGVTNSQTRDTTEITAWGGDVVLNSQTKKIDTFKAKLIESLNLDVLKAAFGDNNVSGTDLTSGITIKANSKELDHAVWIIDRIYNDGTKSRTVIPDGQPTTMDDIVYKDDEAVGFDLTITAYGTTAYTGDTHREYLKKASQSGESGESGTSGE